MDSQRKVGVSANSTTMKTQKVLIIDDEVDFGILMNAFFKKKGYEVYTALSIYEGLRILEEQHPDYIFFDNNLPDGSGWSNAKMVSEKYPDTHLVLMSAMQIPTHFPTHFNIVYKPFIVNELHNMFP